MHWYKLCENELLVQIYAKPNSSKSSISGLYGEPLRLAVRIAAAAVDGAANVELVAFFAKRFKVSKTSIILIKGETSKQKTIKITDDCDRILNEIKKIIGVNDD